MQKIHREDWFSAGMQILESEGFERLTIDALCANLKMTKGSFYHHFRNMDGYIVAFMQDWTEARALEFIRKAESRQLASGESTFFAGLASELCGKAERAIRGWGAASALVRMYLRQVDGIRLKYLEGLMQGRGLEGEAAPRAARMEYALMVGLQQTCPDISHDELLSMYKLRS